MPEQYQFESADDEAHRDLVAELRERLERI